MRLDLCRHLQQLRTTIQGGSMPTIEEWREQQEQNVLYRLSESEGAIKSFLDVGRANRVHSVEQAKLLSALRGVVRWRGKEWSWVADFCDSVEDYQLTVGAPVNSRSQFLDAIKFKQFAEHEKSRFLGVLPGGTK